MIWARVAAKERLRRYAIDLVHARKTISARPRNLRAPSSDAEVSAARAAAGRRPLAEMAAAAAARSSRVDEMEAVAERLANARFPTQKLPPGGPVPAGIVEAKAAIAACTDVAKNDADPTGDGDQSFVPAARAELGRPFLIIFAASKNASVDLVPMR